MGNLLPFTQECVEIQLDGPARLLALRGSPYRRRILLLDRDGGKDRHGADWRAAGVESWTECTVDVKQEETGIITKL